VQSELPGCEYVDGLRPDELPALIAAAAAVIARAAARMAAAPIVVAPPRRDEPDVLLGVKEAAAIAGRSESWLRKHGAGVAGYAQPTGRGGRVGWWRRPLMAWAQDEKR